MSAVNIMRTPEEYENAAVIAKEAADEMLARLEWVTLQPLLVLNAGDEVGELTARLQQRYPAAKVLTHMQTRQGMYEEALILPFPDHSVDLICANFVVPWYADRQAVLREYQRVLRPNGLLMFTAFGPDTL